MRFLDPRPSTLVMTRDKETHVRMGGRDKGIARMQHERHAERFPVLSGQLRAVRGRGRRELLAVNMGKRDAGFFENRSIGQDAGPSAAAFGPRPFIGEECGVAVVLFQRAADRILQRQQVLANGGKVGWGGQGVVVRGSFSLARSEGKENENEYENENDFAGKATALDSTTEASAA